MEAREWKAGKQGQALVFLGSTLHNRAPMGGAALSVGYHAAYLSQRDNLYLAAPPASAKSFPVAIQRLLGYAMPGPILNKLYWGAPHTVHDGVLAAWEAYGNRRVDWAGPAREQPHASAMEARMAATSPPSSSGLHLGNLGDWVQKD